GESEPGDGRQRFGPSCRLDPLRGESSTRLYSASVSRTSKLPERTVPAWGQAQRQAEELLDGEGTSSRPKPTWDSELRELRVGRLLIKRFRQPARNQVPCWPRFKNYVGVAA